MLITGSFRGWAGVIAIGAWAVLMMGCANSSSPGTVVALSVQNSAAAASKVVGSINTIMVSANQTETSVTAAVVDAPAGSFSVAAFAAAQIQALLQLNTEGLPVAVTGAVAATTVACDKGSYTILPMNQDGSVSYQLTYNGCYDQTRRTTYQGTIGIRNLVSSGDLSQPSLPGSLGATFDISGLKVSTSSRGSLTTLQGTFDYSAVSPDGITLQQTVSGPRLSLTRSGDLLILYSFQVAVSEDRNTLAFSLSASGGLHSESLTGSMNFTTPTPLTGINLTTKAPIAGTLEISGRLNSNLLVKPLGSSTVISVDSNGDGKTDFTLHTQWLGLT